MKRILTLTTVLGGALLAGCAPTMSVGDTLSRTTMTAANGKAPSSLTVAQPAPTSSAGTLRLSSSSVSDGGMFASAQVANSFGCSGGNQSPQLSWSGAPAGTAAYALTTYDPDAPTGSGLWHWVVYNIPASTTSLPEGAGSAAIAGATTVTNDAGVAGFVGACPPVGDTAHRYVITLYALSKPLEIPAGSSPAIVGFSLNGAVLAKTSIVAYYRR